MGGSGSGGRDRFNSTNRDDAQSDTQVSSWPFTYKYLKTRLRYSFVHFRYLNLTFFLKERRRNNTTAMYPDSQQLFVGNLPHNCTESDLESLFSQFGKVIIIGIILNII